MARDERKDVARSEKLLPGIWRLRLPCPWPGVPHVNAWAVARGDGIVLFDTGVGGEDGLEQLELALAQAKLKLRDVRLLVCTHTHADHYGLAGPIVDAAGCEIWLHPAWDHIRAMVEDPDAAFDNRLEVARQSGVPETDLKQYEERRDPDPLIARIVPPDRELVDGVEVATDLGSFRTYETPGHAPSHVVFHEPESGMMISGDHLLGKVTVFFDHGHTADPVGDFLESLDAVDELDVRLCLPGHGRTFRDVGAKIQAYRDLVDLHLNRIRDSLKSAEKSPFDIVPDVFGVSADKLHPAMAAWGLQITLAYLDHLQALGDAEKEESGEAVVWRITS
jgi:glyoxylase-like metal-dependent hydrolase (beta-lactamase superfamily II)